jgi:hypothetical protein
MAKREQDELRAALLKARKEPLPSYSEAVEDSVVKHVEALKRHEDEGGSTANLVVSTLTKTLDGLPSQGRIKFLYAVVFLLLAMLAAFVALKIKGVW